MILWPIRGFGVAIGGCNGLELDTDPEEQLERKLDYKLAQEYDDEEL